MNGTGTSRKRRVEHLVSTPATSRSCRRCGSPVLAGVDAGIPAEVDPQPLDEAGALAAILAGRWTYARLRGGWLVRRDVENLRGSFLAARAVAIHADHRCPLDPPSKGINQ